MAEREKVIRGLEAHCKTWEKYSMAECLTNPDMCPYHQGMPGCTGVLAADALALLKEQEARVMTLEELQAIETPWNRNTPPYLFVEGRSSTEARWMSWGFMHDFVRLPGTIGVQNYGTKWRVWNLQPTPEQMRDTPWEEAENADMR